MSETDSLHGLSCPNCGGMVPIPEGQTLVQCPYCELRSFVRGERGIRRYQVPQLVDRDGALKGLRQFLTGHRAIAKEVASKAQITEAFVAYLPFWVQWAKVLGWVFGEEKVGSGDDERWEPREVKIAQEMNWNRAACDVGEFGVDSLVLTTQVLNPFNPDELHAQGMVFEPVNSASEARTAANQDFDARVKKMANLDRVAQVFTQKTNVRLGLVYYPLWVLRYTYRGRAFQVVVDGFNGKVLYGKAPGSNTYRAAVLVGGMATGAFVSVDVSTLAVYFGLHSKDDNSFGLLGAALVVMGVGFGIMVAAYRKFRYGEIYEYRGHEKKKQRRSRQKVGEVYQAREVIQ